MTARNVSDCVLRIGLGAVFVYAGGMKLPDIEAFFWDIHHFELTHPDASMVLAFFLPWLEIFAGLALILRRLYLGGLCLCTALSTVFLGAIGSAWYRGLDITCGCFGREDNATNFPKHIAINCAMLLASLALWWLARDRTRNGEPDAIDTVTA